MPSDSEQIADMAVGLKRAKTSREQPQQNLGKVIGLGGNWSTIFSSQAV